MRFLSFIVLSSFSSISFAASDVVSELKISSLEAASCVRGFSIATQFMGKDEFKGGDNKAALLMVKTACIEDRIVVAFYNATKNGKDAKSLSDIRKDVESLIEKWYRQEAETLVSAEKKFKSEK